MSKGLRVSTTALMAKRSLQLGGLHWHKILNLPTKRNLSTHRRAELAILKLLQEDPAKLDFIRTLNILCCDEMGQVSSEMLVTIDIIFRLIRNSNIYLGGSIVLIICSMDHTQIQPVEGRSFLLQLISFLVSRWWHWHIQFKHAKKHSSASRKSQGIATANSTNLQNSFLKNL